MKYATLLIGNKIYFTNKENFVSATINNVAYEKLTKNADYELCELSRQNVLENLKQSNEKKHDFWYGTLALFILF